MSLPMPLYDTALYKHFVNTLDYWTLNCSPQQEIMIYIYNHTHTRIYIYNNVEESTGQLGGMSNEGSRG